MITLKFNYFIYPNEFFFKIILFRFVYFRHWFKTRSITSFFEYKETIISLLNKFANPKNDIIFVENATPNFLFIRPSGNPIDAKGVEQMITGEIVQEKVEITKIHRFKFLSEI